LPATLWELAMTEVITLTTKRDAKGRAGDWSEVVTVSLTHLLWTNLAEKPSHPLGFRGIRFSPIFALLKLTLRLGWRSFVSFEFYPTKLLSKKTK